LKVLFVEPKDFWLILGQYPLPLFGIIALAGYPEANYAEIDVLDCQAEGLDWDSLERKSGEEYLSYKKSTPMLLPRPGAALRWIVGLLAGGGEAS
jgi:hypothetical protein